MNSDGAFCPGEFDSMAVVHSRYHEAGTVRLDPTTCVQCGVCGPDHGGTQAERFGSAAPMIARDRVTRRHLRIPDDHRPALALIVGHPAVAYHHTIERRLSWVQHITAPEQPS